MAATVDQDPRLARGDNGGAEVDAVDGTAGAFADTVIDRDDDGWFAVALLQAAGDDADDARMPTFAADHEDGCTPDRRVVFDHRDRFVQDRLFDVATLLVQYVEFACDGCGFGCVVGREQP